MKKYSNNGMLLLPKNYVTANKVIKLVLNYIIAMQKDRLEEEKSPHRHCCPPGWRGAAGGCCAAAAGRTTYGGEGQARLAGCALSVLLLSPCTPWGPGWRRRRLCVDASTVN